MAALRNESTLDDSLTWMWIKARKNLNNFGYLRLSFSVQFWFPVCFVRCVRFATPLWLDFYRRRFLAPYEYSFIDVEIFNGCSLAAIHFGF